jgi:hypothetical protein
LEEGWKRRETNDREVWFRVFCQKIGLFCGTRKWRGKVECLRGEVSTNGGYRL